MVEPVASVTENPPSHGISVNRITNLLRRVSRVEPLSGEKHNDADNEPVEQELRLPTPRGPLKGCLTVHVKNCREFNKNASIKKGTQGFLRVSIGGKVKCTMMQLYKDPKAHQSKFPLCFNEWKYFSIQIPKNNDNSIGVFESRRLVMELIVFGKATGIPKLIGKTFIKLLDILNKSQVKHLVDLKHKQQIICKLELEVVITYGSLGYGYSHQLKHPDRDMESLVERSLFLRCPPPDERKDAYYNVVTPNPGEYPDFIRALKPRETTNTADSLISPVILKCMAKRGRILQLHEAMESSEDGVQYLENLVLKKGIPIDTPWRVKRKLLVLSKWRKKVNMVSNLLKFQRFLEPKQQKDTDGTPPMPTKSPYMQQENQLTISQNEIGDISEISPIKAMAAASGLSSQSSQTALSSPTPSLFLSKQDTIKATPLKSRLDHKESPSSVVASIEHPAPSRANSTPRHVTLVLPKSPCTSASILAQPSTIHIPHSTKTIYVPNHLASPSVLTPLMAEGEVEKGNAPLSSSFIKSLSTLTLTPEVERTLHASIQQRQHWQEDQPVSFKYQQESHQPSTPKHQQEYHQPTKPRYKPYYKPSQECLSKGNNDRELGEVCSGTHVGVKCSTAIHCHSYGEQMREEECPGSSTDFRPTPLRDQAPPRLLGAWTENIASLPIPIERGGSGLPSDLGTKTPSSYPLSDSPLTSSSVPLPPLGSQATDTNFPDPDTCTLYSSSVIGGRMNDVNPPALAVEKINSGNSAENIAQSPSASSSRDPLTSWCSSLESGQWPLLSDIDLAPLRSGTVFSPLSPISSTGPLTTSPNFPRPGCTISSKPGKDRPRILETPHHPYHKQSRGCNRKM